MTAKTRFPLLGDDGLDLPDEPVAAVMPMTVPTHDDIGSELAAFVAESRQHDVDDGDWDWLLTLPEAEREQLRLIVAESMESVYRAHGNEHRSRRS